MGSPKYWISVLESKHYAKIKVSIFGYFALIEFIISLFRLKIYQHKFLTGVALSMLQLTYSNKYETTNNSEINLLWNYYMVGLIHEVK